MLVQCPGGQVSSSVVIQVPPMPSN